MKVGRNDLCPCGSEKKYKHCCLGRRRAARDGLDADALARRAAAAAEEWQVDVVPLPTGVADDPKVRPAATLVTASGLVVFSEVLSGVSPEADDLARTLEEALRQAASKVGRWPPRVRVRDGDVAVVLTARLDDGEVEEAAVPEVVAGGVEQLDAVVGALVERLTGEESRMRVSRPLTWAAWGLPEELVAGLFRAAAGFYRAAPWKTALAAQPLQVIGPQGTVWIACVLGSQGRELGLDLFADRHDYARAAIGPPQDFEARSSMLLLSFESGDEVGRPQCREVLRNGWEVAGPEAYPQVATVNTPAGGLRRHTAEELMAILQAVSAFVAHLRDAEGSSPAATWRHDATGCVVGLMPATAAAHGPLLPGGAEGAGAEPGAVLAGLDAVRDDPQGFVAAELEVVDRFAGYLGEEKCLGAAAIDEHAGDASVFVEYLAGVGIPVRAVHQRDLLDSLFERPACVAADGAVRRQALPVSLDRFFSYLAEQEGIVCRWSGAALTGAPCDAWWDPDAVAWRIEHQEGLLDLLMLPDDGLGESDRWGEDMGPDESRLYQELERRWLLWRDELLRQGVDDAEELWRSLVDRQRAWERAPHPDLRGANPMTVVWRERRDVKKGRRRRRTGRRR